MILKLKVGEGYNKLDKNKGTITIYRNKFPWQKDEILLTYSINDIVRRANQNYKFLKSRINIKW